MRAASPAVNRPALHLALLGLTVLTTFSAYLVQFSSAAAAAKSMAELPVSVRLHPGSLLESLAFSLALVAILGSHEMGHYLLAKRHGVDTSLPYFIPIPLFGFGTMGAVIRIRSRIPDRNALVDIGAAGPIAGLCVALPVLVAGILLSRVGPAPILPPDAFPSDNSLIAAFRAGFEALAAWLSGVKRADSTASGSVLLFGNNLLTLGLQRVLVGPLSPGQDLIAHPLFLAGWFGLLVTMLNLVPLGQLDGGHLAHAVLGKHAPTLGKAMAVGMGFLTLFVSASWLLWLLVTSSLVGFNHPPVVEEGAPLTRGRKWICAICAVALVLCIIPTPLEQVLLK